MSQTADAPEPALLTPHVDLRRVEIIVNPRSGSVGPKAAGECETLLASLNLEGRVVECDPLRLPDTIASAIEAKPDVLVILAGDGTARTAAEMAGPDGPLIAPLPGGTMNLLPHALYGTTDWKQALELALTEGRVRNVAGGEADGHPFYVAAILGNPALWAPARESIREAKWMLALLYARRAARRAFSNRLRFNVDDEAMRKGEAMLLLSPLISKAMDKSTGLEAAFVDVRSRVSRNHLGGNIGSSTFRQTLSSILMGRLALEPVSGADRPRIRNEGALTDWLKQACGLTYALVPEPWSLEPEVIARLRPPLNISHGSHPFALAAKECRAAQRRACGL